jgi:hypothetical protein
VLALSPLDNSIWVAGGTLSNNFPGTNAANVYQPATPFQGGYQRLYLVVSNDGTNWRRALISGHVTTMIYGIDFDKEGYPYITGTTNGVMNLWLIPLSMPMATRQPAINSSPS